MTSAPKLGLQAFQIDTRPALLLHGGGHVLFTRKDIHIKHVKNLLERGFLPISFDYRLCPEVNLAEGPMMDACDALAWTISILPQLQLARRDVNVDGSRVAAVGWSSGGHLAMTLAYTAPARGLKAPDSILAFYCPSNFEDECEFDPSCLSPANVIAKVFRRLLIATRVEKSHLSKSCPGIARHII